MKVTVTEVEEQGYKPVDLTIRLETPEEAFAVLALLGPMTNVEQHALWGKSVVKSLTTINHVDNFCQATYQKVAEELRNQGLR